MAMQGPRAESAEATAATGPAVAHGWLVHSPAARVSPPRTGRDHAGYVWERRNESSSLMKLAQP